jgi:Transposase DDE domain/Activator of Hsp90 ATPase homolog 1-like protein
LRYTDRFEDPNLPGEIQVTVALKQASVGTELNIVQEGLPDAIPVEACYLGWQDSLRNLASLVEPKAQCCPKVPMRRIQRSIYEEARDAARALAKTEAFERSRHDRKRVEMLFAHLKRILRLGRLRLRGPRGAQFEFTLAAIAQNLRRLAKLVARPPPVPAPSVA